MKLKRKVVSLCLVAALAVTAIGSASLAYLTDQGSAKNTFTMGKVDISVSEDVGVTGVGTATVLDEGVGATFAGLMPTSKVQKDVTIKNELDSSEAYVRVAVVVNKLEEINTAIDTTYEKILNEDGSRMYDDDDIQAVYDEVFNGWNLNYNKRPGRSGIRLWIDESDIATNEGVELVAVDSIQKTIGGQVRVDYMNKFMSEEEKTQIDGDAGAQHLGDVLQPGVKSYYDKAVQGGERVYVYYLKMASGKTFELSNSMNVPADFDNNRITSNGAKNQVAMFDGLKISVYADAIQSAGFDNDATAAFTALQEAHPMGWWN